MKQGKHAIVLFVLLALTFFIAGCGERDESSQRAPKDWNDDFSPRFDMLICRDVVNELIDTFLTKHPGAMERLNSREIYGYYRLPVNLEFVRKEKRRFTDTNKVQKGRF